MGQARPKAALACPLPTKQARSRKTRDALLAAGWKLLAARTWDEITIGDVVKTARSSVGSFYSRFHDKDGYFDSLAGQWLEQTRAHRVQLYERLDAHGDFAGEMILDVYRRLLAHQNFWRAALARGAANPTFWAPLRATAIELMDRALAFRSEQLGRALMADETRHIRFAFQMANGLINNSLVNRPGPIQPGTAEFETELVRGLRAVAGFD